MFRLQPILPLLKNNLNLNRRRSRTWQILGLIVVSFLVLTLMAVRYLPSGMIDPVSMLKRQDFEDIFVPPIPRPPMHLAHPDHERHIEKDQEMLRQRMQKTARPLKTNDIESRPNSLTNQSVSETKIMSVSNLTEYFSKMSVEQLQQVKSNDIRREKVREMIYHAYSNYAKYAWAANEHRPISKQRHSANVFGSNSLGINIIDSLDTIYLAELKDLYSKSRQWIESEFRVDVASEVSAFEINIRLVGGFLSIYALTNDKLFLDKAQLVADRLLPAFNSATGIPYALIDLSSGRSKNWNWAAGGCAILSELGTMHLEFQYLSQLTGKDIYLQKVEKIRKVVRDASENNMYYNYINQDNGKWCQKHASLGALGDSFYEYLLKSWILSGRKDEQARSMYEQAMKAAEESMLRKTPSSNLMYFGEDRSGRFDPQMGHLTCFVGGLYVLSSKKWRRLVEQLVPRSNGNRPIHRQDLS